MKVFKYVFMFILIASTMALSGCGGDKFAGKWYYINESHSIISMLDITKNGDNYIVKRSAIYYKPEYREVGKGTVEREVSLGAFDRRKEKRQITVPVYEATLNLVVENLNQSTLVENKGQLGSYTYIEKDKTLQDFSSGEPIFYKQGGINELIKQMQANKASYFDKIKSGKVKVSVNGLPDWDIRSANIVKDYKFNEAIPKELQ